MKKEISEKYKFMSDEQVMHDAEFLKDSIIAYRDHSKIRKMDLIKVFWSYITGEKIDPNFKLFEKAAAAHFPDCASFDEWNRPLYPVEVFAFLVAVWRLANRGYSGFIREGEEYYKEYISVELERFGLQNTIPFFSSTRN